jgi:hypothetical protein
MAEKTTKEPVENQAEEQKKENKFDLLTDVQKEKAMELLEKEESKIDWKKTGKRAAMALGGLLTVGGAFLAGKKSGEKHSSQESNNTTSTPQPFDTVQ